MINLEAIPVLNKVKELDATGNLAAKASSSSLFIICLSFPINGVYDKPLHSLIYSLNHHG
jgi:hypothetical protein